MNPRSRHFLQCRASHARVAELADAQDLGSCAARREGSSPSSRNRPIEDVSMRPDTVKLKVKSSSSIDHYFLPSRRWTPQSAPDRLANRGEDPWGEAVSG